MVNQTHPHPPPPKKTKKKKRKKNNQTNKQTNKKQNKTKLKTNKEALTPLSCPVRINSVCFTSGTRHVSLVKYRVISHD